MERLQKVAQALASYGQQKLATEVAGLSLAVKSAGSQTRPLSEIAAEIYADWKSVNFAAKPYLEAMAQMNKITDDYGYDSGKSIVLYFLNNAKSWRGEKAKAIKDELKKMAR